MGVPTGSAVVGGGSVGAGTSGSANVSVVPPGSLVAQMRPLRERSGLDGLARVHDYNCAALQAQLGHLEEAADRFRELAAGARDLVNGALD